MAEDLKPIAKPKKGTETPKEPIETLIEELEAVLGVNLPNSRKAHGLDK